MGTNIHEPPLATDVKLNPTENKQGLVFISNNKFLKRLWFQISNGFRYVFTGRVRY